MPLEISIEEKVCDYAEQQGVLVLKLNVMGQRGWPDRMLIYKSQLLFIEFKQPGEKPRKLQEYRANQIHKNGFRVEVVDDVEQGRRIVDYLTNHSPVV